MTESRASMIFDSTSLGPESVEPVRVRLDRRRVAVWVAALLFCVATWAGVAVSLSTLL